MDLLRPMLDADLNAGRDPDIDTIEEEARAAAQTFPSIPTHSAWDPEQFAADQIRGLVRQVFFPGWPKPSRQVLFTAVEPTTYVAEICVRVAETLAADFPGNIAVVEANLRAPELETVFGTEHRKSGPILEKPGVLRGSSYQLSRNLWLVPSEVLQGRQPNGSSAPWLRTRIQELGLEFDYSVLHGPPVGLSSDAAGLGNLCDGVVLVLEANSTRRVAARKAKEALHGANARFLGSVLSERTFPVPEGIYRMV